MLLLLLVPMVTFVVGFEITYIDKDGNGAIVNFKDNPYAEHYITSQIGYDCKLHPSNMTVNSTKYCWARISGYRKCGIFNTHTETYDIHQIDIKGQCDDRDAFICIVKSVDYYGCSYYIFSDPTGIALFVIIVVIAVAMLFFIVFCCCKRMSYE